MNFAADHMLGLTRLRWQVKSTMLDHHVVAIETSTHHGGAAAPAAHGHAAPDHQQAALAHSAARRRSSIKPEIGAFLHTAGYLLNATSLPSSPLPLSVAQIAARRASIDPSKASAAAAAAAADRTHHSTSGMSLSMASFDPHSSLRSIFHAPEVAHAGAWGQEEGEGAAALHAPSAAASFARACGLLLQFAVDSSNCSFHALIICNKWRFMIDGFIS
jgi:hypothetical protein